MREDYTVNDAFKDGFENGLLYVLRYYEWVSERHLLDNDISELCDHLEEKKPWMTSGEWYDMINSYMARWRKE